MAPSITSPDSPQHDTVALATTCFQRAAQLNNAGLVWMRRGDYPKAARALGRGLKLIQKITATSKASPPQNIELIDEAPLLKANARFESCLISNISSSLDKPGDIEKIPNEKRTLHDGFNTPCCSTGSNNDEATLEKVSDEKYLYTRPVRIQIRKQHQHQQQPSQSCCARVSSSIIFNLAIAHHILGRTTKTALRMYQLAYRMETTNGSNGVMRVMGILNNLGHLLHQTDTHKADQFWNLLLSLIMYSRQRQETTVDASRFMANVTHLMLSKSCTAKAA